MNKHYKLFLILSIIIISIFTSKLYFGNKEAKRLSELSIQYEAKSIANLLIAFRTTYQNIFTDNHLKLDKSNIDFLPVKTTNEISKIFSSLNVQSKVETVSSRPRNQKNSANQLQLDDIKYFNNNKKIKYRFRKVDDKYYYSQPLYITDACMKCHGNKHNAPNIIQQNYDSAYNYNIGDLRGIINIEITQTELSKILEKNNIKRLFSIVILTIGILMVLFFYAQYNKIQEEKLREKDFELTQFNKQLKLKVAEETEKNHIKDQQLLQQSRLAQMGEMISMIAHQWRQPLAAIGATNTTLHIKAELGTLDKEVIIHHTNKIASFVSHLSSTIDDFRNFFKINKQKNEVTCNKLVQDVLSIVETSIVNKNIQIIVNQNCNTALFTFENEIKQVLLNLIKNAEDILLEKQIKDPIITIDAIDSTIMISDNGGGISEDIITKIFDPYFSTKKKKDGTGLGLYMSKIIIEQHCGAKLTVYNGKDGAVFKIDFIV